MVQQGAMVVVVGPSGVGKDSLLRYAAMRLCGVPSVLFVQRAITRHTDSGGEIHQALTVDEFEQTEQRGGFAVSWRAHGLMYGVPSSTKDWVNEGGVAVVNGSRQALPLFSAAFSNLLVVSIVAQPQAVALRLRSRGRESEVEIQKRLRRGERFQTELTKVFTLDNSGELASAGNKLVKLLGSVCEDSRSFEGGGKQCLFPEY